MITGTPDSSTRLQPKGYVSPNDEKGAKVKTHKPEPNSKVDHGRERKVIPIGNFTESKHCTVNLNFVV